MAHDNLLPKSADNESDQPISIPETSPSEAVINGAIVVTAVITIGIGVAAVCTDNWHYTSNAVANMQRGLFRTCSVESVEGKPEYFCHGHDHREFCGHGVTAIRNRFTWPSVFAVLSLITLALIPTGAVAGWFLFKPRPKVFMGVAALSVAFMLAGVTIFVHTLDAWYFCNLEYCEFTRVNLLNNPESLCLSGLGFSFVLAMVYLGGVVLVMLFAALYARWLRTGLIVDLEPVYAAERAKAKAAKAGEQSSDQDASPNEAVGAEGALHGGVQVMSTSLDDPAAEWTFDPATGMHWSAVHQLYLEAATSRFYDPNTDCWYNPATDVWEPAHSRSM
jgi:hypothetical protein